MFIHLFFCPFVFSGHFCSVDACVVSDGCDESSSTLSFKSSNCYVDASALSSVLVSPLPPSFLHIYCLCTSSQGCKAFLVMSILVHWFICLSSLVHFDNGPEYLTSGAAQVFILLVIFLLCSLFSSSFLVL